MHHLLFYDNDCGFCRWTVRKVLEADRSGKLEAVAIADPRADKSLSGLSPTQRLASWHLVGPGGEVFSGGAAVAPLTEALNRGKAAGRLAAKFPRVTQVLYELVARNRHHLGRLLREESCVVPDRSGSPNT